jgi:hypothetical protein
MASRIPVSTVINLTEVFGPNQATANFVTRYLRAQHADLFFADAAILVEGPAERMLVPNFIRAKFPVLNKCYVTLLEIGGSHAHRLRPLIEHLGLLTLIITDLDSLSAKPTSAAQPCPAKGQTTDNVTLRDWVPKRNGIDDLWAAEPVERTLEGDEDPLFAVRAAYQLPIELKMPGSPDDDKAYPYTFEDALAFENLEFFKTLEGYGLVAKFRKAIEDGGNASVVGDKFFQDLRTGKKAEFALDVLNSEKFDTLKVPTYIADGLTWLEERLQKKQVEILPTKVEGAE